MAVVLAGDVDRINLNSTFVRVLQSKVAQTLLSVREILQLPGTDKKRLSRNLKS